MPFSCLWTHLDSFTHKGHNLLFWNILKIIVSLYPSAYLFLNTFMKPFITLMPSFNDHNCPHHLSFVQANVTLPGGDNIMIWVRHQLELFQILFEYFIKIYHEIQWGIPSLISKMPKWLSKWYLTLLGQGGCGLIQSHYFQMSISWWKKGSVGPKFCDFS